MLILKLTKVNNCPYIIFNKTFLSTLSLKWLIKKLLEIYIYIVSIIYRYLNRVAINFKENYNNNDKK